VEGEAAAAEIVVPIAFMALFIALRGLFVLAKDG